MLANGFEDGRLPGPSLLRDQSAASSQMGSSTTDCKLADGFEVGRLPARRWLRGEQAPCSQLPPSDNAALRFRKALQHARGGVFSSIRNLCATWPGVSSPALPIR